MVQASILKFWIRGQPSRVFIFCASSNVQRMAVVHLRSVSITCVIYANAFKLTIKKGNNLLPI